MDDRRIVELFLARSEEALLQIDIKYGRYCHRVAFNILGNAEDSEECVNDTWLRAWNTMPPNRPGVLSAFLSKITRNLSLDRYKASRAAKRGGGQLPLALEELGDCVPATSTVEEAVELVVYAFQNAESGDIMVQKAPACTIGVLAQAVKELFRADNEIKVIGIRHGEKMYETLLTNEECAHAIDMGNFYRVPADKRGLNYDKYFTDGNLERAKLSEFNSNNTELMDVEQVKEKLLTLSYIRDEIAEWEKR